MQSAPAVLARDKHRAIAKPSIQDLLWAILNSKEFLYQH